MARILMSALTGFCLLAAGSAGEARAQAASGCEQGQALLQARAPLIQRIQGFAKKKPTASEACSLFTRLAANGAQVVKWIEANGAWCQVPEQVGATMKADQAKVAQVRTQTCNVAAQQAKLDAQAKRQQSQQQAAAGERNPLGGADEVVGGGLKLPQGAL